MGNTSSSEQECEDQLHVALSEFVSCPSSGQVTSSFEQVMDQAFDQANSHAAPKRRLWPFWSSNSVPTPTPGEVSELRVMGF